uniref:Uncharacterized protein n=1 Tax=Triticum urartu TaxID=4572 RepID=A0A8R7TU88_TRIUA
MGSCRSRASGCPRSCASPRRRRPRTRMLSMAFWLVSTSRSSCCPKWRRASSSRSFLSSTSSPTPSTCVPAPGVPNLLPGIGFR